MFKTVFSCKASITRKDFSCLGQSERKGDQQIVRQANGEAVRKGYRKKNQQDDKEIERKNDHQNDPPEGNQGDA